jgi:multiple sugar transport system permease protein
MVTLLFLLPMMVVPAVSGFIFSMLFQTDGPINSLLSAVLPGSVHVHWLDDPSVALWSVTIVDIWQWTPLMFLILLSALISLPEDQLNQARILDANFWFQLRKVILPMMKPVIIIALIIRVIETFKLFDATWLLTQGGPGDATSTISVYLYRQTFENARWGYASAAAIIVLIMVSIGAIFAVRPIEQGPEEADLGKPEERARSGSERAAEDPGVAASTTASDWALSPLESAGTSDDYRPPRFRRLRPLARWTAIGALAAIFLFPIYWAVTMAFKPEAEWVPIGKTIWFPEHPTLDNFKHVLGLIPRGAFFAAGGTDASGPIKTSLIASGGGTLLALAVGVLAAYSIGRFRAGGKVLPFQILQLRMFPAVAVIIPLMIFWSYLNLIDTYWGLILVYGAITFPFVVWLMRSFFQDVPKEIGEAAIVDGCTQWGAFFKAILPQVKGGLAATALFVFILNWSDFLVALVLSQQNVITAPVFLNSMQSVGAGQLYGPQAALSLILILPPALFAIFIQRYLVRGLTFGAIKS